MRTNLFYRATSVRGSIWSASHSALRAIICAGCPLAPNDASQKEEVIRRCGIAQKEETGGKKAGCQEASEAASNKEEAAAAKATAADSVVIRRLLIRL